MDIRNKDDEVVSRIQVKNSSRTKWLVSVALREKLLQNHRPLQTLPSESTNILNEWLKPRGRRLKSVYHKFTKITGRRDIGKTEARGCPTQAAIITFMILYTYQHIPWNTLACLHRSTKQVYFGLPCLVMIQNISSKLRTCSPVLYQRKERKETGQTYY